MLHLTNKKLKHVIQKSQHCQRNWDLSKQIPEEDIDLLKYAATQCPSKQNSSFYDCYFITNRNLIETISSNTRGFYIENIDQTVSNSQTMANMLVILINSSHSARVEYKINKNYEDNSTAQKDKLLAVGVCAGYLNLTASMLGYNTGCCTCFDNDAIKKIIDTDQDILLMMGIGYKNTAKNRRLHHNDDEILFPSQVKEKIIFKYIS